MSILETLKTTLPNYGLTIKDFFYLGSLFYTTTTYEKEEACKKLKIPITEEGPKIFPIHQKKFLSVLNGKEVMDDETLKSLATELKNIYPKGKKDYTNSYWAEGVALIESRLKLFFRKFGYHSPEEIIDATKRYVDSFNGDYSYMRVLKYFIFKDIKGEEGIEKSSDLLNYIENKNDIDNSNFDVVEIC